MVTQYFCRVLSRGGHRFFLTFLLLCCIFLAPPGAAAKIPRWQPPIAGEITVVREFQKPAQKWSAGHRGVDLELKGNLEVRSPAAGKVTFSGMVVDRQVITVEHSDGRRSSFEPVTEALPAGSEVAAGQVIAQVDRAVAHCQIGTCVHWGVREGHGKQQEYVNPLLFLGLADPSVLLPIGHSFSA